MYVNKYIFCLPIQYMYYIPTLIATHEVLPFKYVYIVFFYFLTDIDLIGKADTRCFSIVCNLVIDLRYQICTYLCIGILLHCIYPEQNICKY